jgi:hypothetical protein
MYSKGSVWRISVGVLSATQMLLPCGACGLITFSSSPILYSAEWDNARYNYVTKRR